MAIILNNIRANLPVDYTVELHTLVTSSGYDWWGLLTTVNDLIFLARDISKDLPTIENLFNCRIIGCRIIHSLKTINTFLLLLSLISGAFRD